MRGPLDRSTAWRWLFGAAPQRSAGRDQAPLEQGGHELSESSLVQAKRRRRRFRNAKEEPRSDRSGIAADQAGFAPTGRSRSCAAAELDSTRADAWSVRRRPRRRVCVARPGASERRDPIADERGCFHGVSPSSALSRPCADAGHALGQAGTRTRPRRCAEGTGRARGLQREDAERFIAEVRGDDPDLASYLRIVEREVTLLIEKVEPYNLDQLGTNGPTRSSPCSACSGSDVGPERAREESSSKPYAVRSVCQCRIIS